MFRTYLVTFLFLLTFVSFITSCDKSTNNNNPGKTIEDMLVKNNEITGWSYLGAGWTANNLSELTTYIDGAAEVYQKHAFVEASSRQYQGSVNNNTSTLDITIFKQSSNTDTQNLFNDPDIGLSGAVNWESGAGESAHYARYSGLSQVMTFYRNNYFVYIKIDTDTDESLSIIKQFALNIDNKIK